MMEEVDLADTPLAMRPQLQSQDSTTGADDEPPDPRIQVELERLNTSTDLINKLEVDLDEARMLFRHTLSESSQQIDHLAKKLGKCVEQARPYYEARIKAKQALTEAQKSAVRYERAVSQHAAAREMVQLAEEGLLVRGCIFDSTWQEMLNHATTKVNDAEKEKIESTSEHKEKSSRYHDSETRVKFLQKELKRSIAKSSLNARRSLLQLSHIIRMQDLQLLPYFELKAAVNQRLEEQKRHVRELEAAVASAKANYSQALTNLETISDQIHKTRQNRVDLGIRGVGVGAESPGPPFATKREREIANEKLSSKESPMTESSLKYPEKNPSLDLGTAKTNATVPSPSTSSEANSIVEPVMKNSVLGKNSSVADERLESVPVFPHLAPSLALQTSEKKGSAQVDYVEDLQPHLKMRKSGEEPSNFSGEIAPPSEASEAHTSYLSGWQFVGLPNAPASSSQSLLSVDDRESVVSDSESLTSIEMLSEEAIANLMLEDEINEASHSICTPHFTDEYLSPPTCKTGAMVPPLVPGGSRFKENNGSKGTNNPSQASSSDSGEPWEVVSESQDSSGEPCSDKKGVDHLVKDAATAPDAGKEDSALQSPIKPVDSAASQSKEVASKNSFISASEYSLKDPAVETNKSTGISQSISVSSLESNRPQSLPVSALYSESSSNSSSPITSNSLSEEFSPSYAPLGDTPEVETKASIASYPGTKSALELSQTER